MAAVLSSSFTTVRCSATSAPRASRSGVAVGAPVQFAAAKGLRASSSVALAGKRVETPLTVARAAPSPSTVSPVARGGGGRRGGRNEPDDGFEERLVQVRRVTTVKKGGKLMSFRAVVVAGNGEGKVGVGCSKAKEVMDAVRKASIEAKKTAIDVKLSTKARTLAHRATTRAGGAVVMLRPASEGTGVIAGGSVRVVLELAGVKNCFGKELGSPNALNNARATVKGLAEIRSFNEVAEMRGLTVEELFA